jgi:hypothetical protein
VSPVEPLNKRYKLLDLNLCQFQPHSRVPVFLDVASCVRSPGRSFVYEVVTGAAGPELYQEKLGQVGRLSRPLHSLVDHDPDKRPTLQFYYLYYLPYFILVQDRNGQTH